MPWILRTAKLKIMQKSPSFRRNPATDLYSARLKIQHRLRNFWELVRILRGCRYQGIEGLEECESKLERSQSPRCGTVFFRSSFRRYLYRPSVGPKKSNPQSYSSKVEFSAGQSILCPAVTDRAETPVNEASASCQASFNAIFAVGMSFTAKIFVSAIEITVKMSIFAWV